MAVAANSDQNVQTADEFESPIRPLVVMLSIDDVALAGELNRDQWIFSQDKLCFVVDVQTIVKFEEKKESARGRLIIDVGAAEPAFWKLLYQARVYAGSEKENLVSVDQFNVDFLPGSKPVTVDVADESVRIVQLQLRTINKMYWPFPSFDEGDVFLLFKDEPPLRTWSALLAGASPYLAERLASIPNCDGLDLGTFPRKDVEQMLYQLYPTNWPLYLSFDSIARAANAYRVPLLLYRLSKHLINFPIKCPVENWKYAMDKNLYMTVQVMVYEDVKSGVWDKQIANGFQPEAFFSPSFYRNAICPVILAARGITHATVRQDDPWRQPDYFSPGPNKVALVFLKTKFYVNQGVLAVHGTVLKEGEELSMTFSSEMQFYCGREELLPGKVLMAVLDSLHPGGPAVKDSYLKPALILCHDQGWTRAKENLEQRLLTETSETSQQLYEQIRFAETFGLENSLRALILRVETDDGAKLCKPILEKKSGIAEKTRQLLSQRMKDGWGKQSTVDEMKPTGHRDRVIGNKKLDHRNRKKSGVDPRPRPHDIRRFDILNCPADRVAARNGIALAPIINVNHDRRMFLDVLALVMMGENARNVIFENWIYRGGIIAGRPRKSVYNTLHRNIHHLDNGWKIDLVVGYVEILFDRDFLPHPEHIPSMQDSPAAFVLKCLTSCFCRECVASPYFHAAMNEMWPLFGALSPRCLTIQLT